MLHFDYEIKLDEMGDPQVIVSKYHEEIPEDKFMIIALASVLINNLLENPEYMSTFDDYSKNAHFVCNNVLQLLKKDVGNHIKDRVVSNPDGKNYDIEVTTIVRRNALNYNGIIYEGKIYKREIGLKVLVLETMKVYELNGGIDNENWVEV